MLKGFPVLVVPLFLVFIPIGSVLRADDAKIGQQLQDLGGVVKFREGVVTEVSFRNSRELTAAHWKSIGELSGLKKLTTYGHADSLNDDTVGFLAGLQSLESLSTDGAQLSDDGLAKLAALKSLRSAAFFHLSFRKEGFTGTGFAAWTALPKLEQLTVAGMSMGDDGIAAIATLKNLRGLRIWHTYRSEASNDLIAKLPRLSSLKLGQRLPGSGRKVCLNDQSLEKIATITTLEQLEVGEAAFTVYGLTKLAELPALKRLKIDRVELKESEVDAIRAKLANVKVDFVPMTDSQRTKLKQYLK